MLSLIHLLYITTGTVIMHDVTTFKMTYVAAGSAVVPPPHQSIERLFTLHTHRHFVVPDPARGALPQLRVLHQNKNILSRTVQRVDSLTGCATLDVTLTDTSSTSFNAFLNDSFFCWKISMVSWKAWRKKKIIPHYLQTHKIKWEKFRWKLLRLYYMYLNPACLVLLWAEEEM